MDKFFRTKLLLDVLSMAALISESDAVRVSALLKERALFL